MLGMVQNFIVVGTRRCNASIRCSNTYSCAIFKAGGRGRDWIFNAVYLKSKRALTPSVGIRIGL